jgi:Tfp pilus assembly protein PilF
MRVWDEAAALFVRPAKRGEMPWKEVDANAPDLFAERHSSSEAIERFNISARIKWHLSLGNFERTLEEFEKIDRHERESPGAQAMHVMLLQSTGRIDEAEAILRRLSNDDPANARVLKH